MRLVRSILANKVCTEIAMNYNDDSNHLKTLSILYVEDDDGIRGQLCQFLKRRCRTLHTAANGKQGLTAFELYKPDIVITDILMPIMDGLKMSASIRAINPKAAIIITTAFEEPRYFHQAIDIGIDKYIAKPIDLAMLEIALFKCTRAIRAEVALCEAQRCVAELLKTQRDENKMLNREVNHMQKLESIGRLTTGLAHNFNNILSSMLGYNELNEFVSEDITDEMLRAELENNTKQISLAGQRAVALIKKMMTYCGENTTTEKMDVQPVQEVINDVLEMLSPALTSRIRLEFVDKCYSDNGVTRIQIDAIDLHQILTNLAVNARDAMNEHKGIIAITLKKITDLSVRCAVCSAKVEGDFIELSLSDDGTGMGSSIITKIFDPFFTTKKVGEGTGLGLSTVSGMMHAIHGHILVDSNLCEPNQGTTFRLLFPEVQN
jgi:signal transduction histidine kinase